MKFGLTVALALLLLVVESVLVKYAGWEVTRIDVTVVLVVFLALRANLVEGAFASFVVGYLLDVMSGRPTMLYVFLAVLTFLLARMAASLVDVRTLPSFLLLVGAADAGHSLLAVFFTWMTSKEGFVATQSLLVLVLQALLTAAAAALLWPLLRRIDPGTDRPEAGALR